MKFFGKRIRPWLGADEYYDRAAGFPQVSKSCPASRCELMVIATSGLKAEPLTVRSDYIDEGERIADARQ